MIDYKKLGLLIQTFRDVKFSPVPWQDLLEVEKHDFDVLLERAIKGCIGNFNFWEGDDGSVAWPKGISGTTWFKAAIGKQSVDDYNLAELRKSFLAKANLFIGFYQSKGITPKEHEWWLRLAEAFGNDPLHKRETLLWNILYDCGYKDFPCPNILPIDYNIIIALRHQKVLTGFIGNIFSLEEETHLRYEALCCGYYMAQHVETTPTNLDAFLYRLGKDIRENNPDWELSFCYRKGCYFY